MLIFIALTSCEKVIDVELKAAAPMLVIEGIITNEAGPYYVIVSKSQRFSDSTQYITVNDALVIVVDDTVHKPDTLVQVLNGLYETQSTSGMEGRTYTLQVAVDGKTYLASCTMPYAVNLDTVLVDKDPTTPTGFALTPVYTDPAEADNFYRFNAFEADDHIPLIRVRNDKATNGTLVKQPVGFESYYNAGDRATLEMMCIDGRVYEYLFGLSQTVNTGLNAPVSPGNPHSNISGGCLGYFSAHTVQRKTVLIP